MGWEENKLQSELMMHHNDEKVQQLTRIVASSLLSKLFRFSAALDRTYFPTFNFSNSLAFYTTINITFALKLCHLEFLCLKKQQSVLKQFFFREGVNKFRV